MQAPRLIVGDNYRSVRVCRCSRLGVCITAPAGLDTETAYSTAITLLTVDEIARPTVAHRVPEGCPRLADAAALRPAASR